MTPMLSVTLRESSLFSEFAVILALTFTSVMKAGKCKGCSKEMAKIIASVETKRCACFLYLRLCIQAGHTLTGLQCQVPKCWEYRQAPPYTDGDLRFLMAVFSGLLCLSGNTHYGLIPNMFFNSKINNCLNTYLERIGKGLKSEVLG